MPISSALPFITWLTFVLQTPAPRQPPLCAEWRDCREQALAAAAEQDYERFHDLAWRAVQKGPKNDPALMTMLARAQSLSGRPHDALVMLQRLAAAGVATDAATNDEYRRVRALPGWSDFEASLAAAPPAPGTADDARPDPAKTRELPSSDPPKAAPAPPTEEAASPVAPRGAPARVPDDALRFSSIVSTHTGLAYDAVSGRFIVGDRVERRLAVVGERTQRFAILAGAHSAGFGEIAAFAIDPREGDLWVASGPGAEGTAQLHKLQLISGRALFSLSVSESAGPAKFVDVAVFRSTVLAADAEGRRLFRVRPRSKEMEIAATFDTRTATSVAPASDTTAYVAYTEGILRVDLAARKASPLKARRKVSISGLTWIRWHGGTLVGIQRIDAEKHRVVRIGLDRAGRTATKLDVLDDNVHMAGATAATLAGDVLFYLAGAPPADDGSAQTIVRRVSVK